MGKIKNEMMQYELIAEDLSGDTLFVEVSALKKINLLNPKIVFYFSQKYLI